MNVFGEAWMVRHATYFSDPEAGPEALLNDATEWLRYAHNSVQLLGELVQECGRVDMRRLAVMLDGIAAYIEMGTRCAAQAHLRMQCEQVRRTMETEHPAAAT